MRFSYALQIQPRNGQQIDEYPHGLEIARYRLWDGGDSDRFAQAERQVSAGNLLIVDRDDDLVYEVDHAEAVEPEVESGYTGPK